MFKLCYNEHFDIYSVLTGVALQHCQVNTEGESVNFYSCRKR